MKQVIMIGPASVSKGGIATVIANFEKTFASETVNIHYIASWKEGSALFKLWMFIRAIMQFCYLAITQKIDIVHIHTSQKGSFYRKMIFINIAKLFRSKVILHMHGSRFGIFYDQQTSFIQKRIVNHLNRLDHIIVLSEAWKTYYENMCDTPVSVMENAVEVPRTNPYNNTSKTIVTFGNVSQEKGSYDLLRAIQSLGATYQEYEFIFYGIGDIETAQTQIDQNNLTNVTLGGWVESHQKQTILESALLHILPSYHEALPMAILETMAHGIPNISTNVGGIPQIIQDKQNGLLIEPGDITELHEAIADLLDNQEARELMSTKAHHAVQDQFSMDACNNKWEQFYENL
ncbi:glycosyltransferase family 4 protein [Listeria grandensis]|uniref:Glycosyltransferase family 4 protein n=1 Tax=Listeria grandensis TaxID=1494963 RepID=A0A7X0Y4L0_9LIST|nr:glycosyltransferase family 4 protein [Listeria grandensis]MBC1475335.1 glycosyltransferase family 4 protein [Listeria grandensis]MBC1936499.1 glycosyltransferase family 4 protein [Listeria grandensis]